MPGSRRGGPELPYSIVAGVTPCPGGWLVGSAKVSGATFAAEDPRVYDSFIAILDERPSFTVIALNVPIGYLQEVKAGGRTCDRQARALLGAHRGSCVHSAPTRPMFRSALEDATAPLDAISRRLLPRYREAQMEMAPYLQRTVYEAHPELSFFQLNGNAPLLRSKRSEMGRVERRKLLEARIPGVKRILDARVAGARSTHLLDVAAIMWTARRIAARAATRLPADPEWDSEGLRMEMIR